MSEKTYDEYGREIEEPKRGLIDTPSRPLQTIFNEVGDGQYGKESARYFVKTKTRRPRYAVR